jgi:hypothetical protein
MTWQGWVKHHAFMGIECFINYMHALPTYMGTEELPSILSKSSTDQSHTHTLKHVHKNISCEF